MLEFQRVLDEGELADPGKALVEIEGEMIALFHVGGVYYALDDVCTHDGGPLADGELVDYAIACPRHGAQFDIRSGEALTMPAVRATKAHRVKVEDGGVWVAVGEQRLSPSTGPVATETPAAAAAPQPAPQTAALLASLKRDVTAGRSTAGRDTTNDVTTIELWENGRPAETQTDNLAPWYDAKTSRDSRPR